MLAAEPAILLEFETVGVVLLVLLRVVVALFAFCAGKGNLHSHIGTSLKISARRETGSMSGDPGRSDLVPPSARGADRGLTGAAERTKKNPLTEVRPLYHSRRVL